MCNFFRKKRDAKKTVSFILSSLHVDMVNYGNKYPVPVKSHYRQSRVAYLEEFIKNSRNAYNFGKPEEADIVLRKIVLELYLHYSSIEKVSKTSTIGNSLKKAIIAITGINKSSSTNEIEKAVQNFSRINPKYLKPYSDRISEAEEKRKQSSSFFSRLISPTRGEEGITYINYECKYINYFIGRKIKANKYIDELHVSKTNIKNGLVI